MQRAKLKNTIQNRIQLKNLRTLLFCFLTAFAVLTVCTKSSFLYPLNDWVDANCFFTVGKAIARGKVLYRDIYEQKGPWLYFLHAICYRISAKSFFGVYLLELSAGTAFLYFTAKLMQLYRARGTYVLLPLLAAAVYASYAFCHGDSVEELCLPLFAAGLYLCERAFCENRTLTLREWTALGVLGGLVFWMKFSLVGFFVGLALVPLWKTIRRDGVGELLKDVLCIFVGVFLPSIPVLVYFASAKAFPSLWEAYFYNNLFIYAGSGKETLTAAALLKRYYSRITRYIRKNWLYAVPGLAAVLWYTVTAKGRRAHLGICTLFTVLFVYAGNVAYPYYSLVFSVFTVFAAVALGKGFSRIYKAPVKRWLTVCTAVLALCSAGLLSLYTSSNVYLMQYEKADLPQYKFAKIINSVKNPTLMNYGFLDGGFYMTTGLVPENRYFCRLNINLPEMVVEQSMTVYREQVDFVVTRGKPLGDGTHYICVGTATLPLEGVEFTYYLYAAEHILPALSESGVLSDAQTS